MLVLTGARSPGDFVVAGSEGPSAQLVLEDFGPGVFANSPTGYDGQQSYAIARTFPDLDEAARHLDNPRYRLQRIAPPALASPLPPGNATAMGLILSNLVGIGAAVWAVGRLLDERGLPVAAALAAGAPLLLGVALTTTEPVAWGAAAAGAVASRLDRHAVAVAALVLSVLSRETAVVVAALVALDVARRHGLLAAVRAGYGLPIGALAAWLAYLWARFDHPLPSRTDLLAVASLPWAEQLVVGAVAATGLVGAWMWRGCRPLAASSLVFSAWIALYTEDILDPLALFRVNGLAVGLGLAALSARIIPTRSVAGPRPSDTSPERPG